MLVVRAAGLTPLVVGRKSPESQFQLRNPRVIGAYANTIAPARQTLGDTASQRVASGRV